MILVWYRHFCWKPIVRWICKQQWNTSLKSMLSNQEILIKLWRLPWASIDGLSSIGNTSRRIFLKFRRARVGYTWGSRINKDSRSHWIASWTCSNSQRRLAKKSTQFVRTTAKYRGIRWWCVERFTKTDNSKAWFGYFMVHIRVRRTRTRVHRTLVYILTSMSRSS